MYPKHEARWLSNAEREAHRGSPTLLEEKNINKNNRANIQYKQVSKAENKSRTRCSSRPAFRMHLESLPRGLVTPYSYFGVFMTPVIFAFESQLFIFLTRRVGESVVRFSE